MKNRELPGQARLAVASALLSLALAGCGGSHDKGATQAAAKVNSAEVTVHQINQVLQQQQGLLPEQVESASREVLERLIDQQLAIQQAEELKLDREPSVVAAIEAAKRDIIARAYGERLTANAPKPSAEDSQKYYSGHPALFANRRLFNLLEYNIQAPAARGAEVELNFKQAKTGTEFTDWLNSQGFRFSVNRGSQSSESLPLAIVDRVAALPDGQALLLPTPVGLKLLVVESSKATPVSFDQARGPIEQFLLNDGKRALLESDRKKLRAAAKIEYLGKFAQSAAVGTEPAGVAPAASLPASAAAGLDDSALKKGLGLK